MPPQRPDGPSHDFSPIVEDGGHCPSDEEESRIAMPLRFPGSGLEESRQEIDQYGWVVMEGFLEEADLSWI